MQEMQERNDTYLRLEATAAEAPVRHRPYRTLQAPERTLQAPERDRPYRTLGAPAATAPERNRRYRALEGRLEVLTSRAEEKDCNIYEEIGPSRYGPFADPVPLPVPGRYNSVCVCAVSYTHLTLPTNHRV